jgi:hypothetical protein
MRRRGIRAWALGLLHALVAGAANAAAAALADPAHFHFSGAGAVALGKVTAAGAVIGLVMYLKQSPLPPGWNGQERRQPGSAATEV